MLRSWRRVRRGGIAVVLALVMPTAARAQDPEAGGGSSRREEVPVLRPWSDPDPAHGPDVPKSRAERWPTPVPLPRGADPDDLDAELNRDEAVRLRDDTDDLKHARDRLQRQRGRGPARTAKDRELEKRIERLEEDIRDQEERALQLAPGDPLEPDGDQLEPGEDPDPDAEPGPDLLDPDAGDDEPTDDDVDVESP
jgi:hypothetical protein